MEDLKFDSKGHAQLPTKYHGDVSFSQVKWNIICSQSERWWYKFNGEKIPTTLIAPDMVRYHSAYPNQFIYYKKFSTYRFNENVTVPAPKKASFFAVVIDVETKKVCTSYPLKAPKQGKEYKP
jgi:hypothetical protein